MSKFSLILSMVVFASATSHAAGNYVCKADLEDGTRLTALVGNVLLLCRSAQSVNLNAPGMKDAHCAGSSLMISASGGDAQSQTIQGAAMVSVLNSMPENLGMQLIVQKNNEASVGILQLASNVQLPKGTFPANSTLNCVVK